MWKEFMLLLKDPEQRRPVIGVTLCALGILFACFLILAAGRTILGPIFAILMIIGLFTWFVETCLTMLRRKLSSVELMYGILLFTAALIASIILCFAKLYTHFGIINQKGELVYDVSSCIYFSIITWTTVGYGDFVPTPESRIFASAEALCGYIAMALYIAIFVSLASLIKPDPTEPHSRL